MHQAISARTYVGVCVALLALTVATVGATYIDLGPLHSVVGLLIAGSKAALILLYFMHIRHANGLVRLALIAGLLWLGLLLVGAMDDYLTRSWLPVPGK